MHKGVIIEDNLCRFTDIQHYGGEGVNQWYHVVLMEGRNREVRKALGITGREGQSLKKGSLRPAVYSKLGEQGKIQRAGQNRDREALETG